MLHSSRHSLWSMLADAAMMSSVHSSRHSLWTLLADAAMMVLPLLLVDQHRGLVAAMPWQCHDGDAPVIGRSAQGLGCCHAMARPTLDVPNRPAVHVQELSDQ